MIEKERIEAYLIEILEARGMFPVEVKVDNNGKIRVQIDKMQGVTIDDCASVSRELEGKLDRDKEDFALEVSSPGLDAPFRVREQYEKNIGEMVSVQYRDGRKILGILKKAGESRILLEVKVSEKGKEAELQEIDMDEIVSTRLHIQF